MSAKYHKIFFNKSPISAEPIHIIVSVINTFRYNFFISLYVLYFIKMGGYIHLWI